MNSFLETYWIDMGDGLSKKFGVTAYSYEDAIFLLHQFVFSIQEMPPIVSVQEGIKFDELDQQHVVPNMGPIAVRGIWFPNYSHLNKS